MILGNVVQKDITPESSITGRLGIDHKIKPLDPLKVYALALKSGKNIFVNIVCDIVGVTRGIHNRICAGINKKAGIDPNKIVITAIHTHSSPWVWDLQADQAALHGGFNPLDRIWMDKVVNQSVKAAVLAVEKLKPVKISYGKSIVEKIASNRVDPVSRGSNCPDFKKCAADEGVIDPYVQTVTIKDALTNELMGIFCEYACHPAAFGGGKTEYISPDFPYYAKLHVNKVLNTDIPVVYWQGCAGNINTGKYNPKVSIQNVRKFGIRFADAVLHALNNSVKPDQNTFEYEYKKISLPTGEWIQTPKQAKEEFQKINKKVNYLLNKGEKIEASLVSKWRMAIKRLDICLLSQGKSMDVDMQLLKIGNTNILFVPGEWFVQMNLYLQKKFLPENVVIVTLNNFDLLYIPDKQSLKHKNWYGVNTKMRSVADCAGKILQDTASELILKKL